MGWFVHHVNVQAHDVRQSAAFYRDIIGLKDGAWVYPETVGEVGHNPDSIAAFGSLNRGIHVVRAIPTFPRDNNLLHNPTIGGHFAFNVPDICCRQGAAGSGGRLCVRRRAICDGWRQPNLLLRPKP